MKWTLISILPVCLCLFCCSESPPERAALARTAHPAVAAPPQRLSEYGLFLGNGASQEPAAGVVPYDLRTPLFSDYAAKYRFLKLPEQGVARYRSAGVLDLPVGTIIAKTFAYAADLRATDGPRRLIETRILKHTEDGWIGLPYIWNPEETEAFLEITGGKTEVSFVHTDGSERHLTYRIPNVNQCKGCHRTKGRTMAPIGIQAGQLNGPFDYPDGTENQLAHWIRVGALAGAPDPAEAPRYAIWDDPATGSLGERSRIWLDINCAHCHNPEGPARTSGLDLSFHQSDPTMLGVDKYPVAAGRGSGTRLFDIKPGDPDGSILLFRLESVDPGIMMPELGRSVVHQESLALIRQWIVEMPAKDRAPASRSAG